MRTIGERGRHHPLRWRPFTWVIVDLDGFVLGSILGLVVAYNLMTPFSGDAQEGAAILGSLLVLLALCANGLLGLAWIVTAIVARRRRPEGEQARSRIWVGAPIAFLTGVLLVGGSFWSTYGRENTRTWRSTPTETPNVSPGLATEPGSEAMPGRITWPEGQALPAFSPARHLWVVDVKDAPGSQQMLFTTLEGLVNRRRPRIYLIQTPPEDEQGRFWLRHLDAPFTVLESPWELFDRFADAVRGTIVYDPAVPDTINVATTLAGLERAVVTTPKVAERLRTGYGLPVLDDLRGRFTDALDAYTWQYEELWPRTTHRMLISLPPRRGQPFGKLRDYAVANGAMVYWLDPTDAVERALYERFLADVQPGTAFLGWFPCCGPEEWSGVELLSEHGVITFAADWFENMTVLSAPCCHQMPNPPSTPVPPLEDKIYVTFTFSDGDNLAYDQGTMRKLWDDPDRGRVPMNWTISPALWDAAPAILRFYRHTATGNDLLMAGPSGLGYVYPTPWSDDTFHLFTELSGRYMERAGLDIVWIFNMQRGRAVEMSPSESQAYIDDTDPLGIMLMYGPRGVGLLGDTTPQSPGRGAASVADAQTGIAEMSAGWDHNSPLFLSIYMIAWDTSPSDVVEIADSLGPEYEVVRADHFFELIKEAQPAEAAPMYAATASGSDESSPPELAVDGDPSTLWNAGAFASQWIEIDLGATRSIEEISLLTAQSPEGETVHRVLGRTGAADPYRPLHEFAGFTSDDRWLTYSPPAPWENVRFLRVETTVSPSWVAWREIVIHLEPAA